MKKIQYLLIRVSYKINQRINILFQYVIMIVICFFFDYFNKLQKIDGYKNVLNLCLSYFGSICKYLYLYVIIEKIKILYYKEKKYI